MRNIGGLPGPAGDRHAGHEADAVVDVGERARRHRGGPLGALLEDPVELVAVLEQLAKQVRSGPLVTEVAFPYHPHVTVAHHLDDVALDKAFHELDSFECEFDVEEFWLYEHDDRAGWQPTRSFALTGSE
jgi:hypothetical protein